MNSNSNSALVKPKKKNLLMMRIRRRTHVPLLGQKKASINKNLDVEDDPLSFSVPEYKPTMHLDEKRY